MKKIALTMALIMGSFGGIYPLMAAQKGRVSFHGAVVNATCAVAAESQDQIIYMGQVRSNQLHAPGSWSNTTPFRIILNDCTDSNGELVAVMFNGATDANDPRIFSVGTSAGSAKGVGIGIFDFRDEVVIPGSRPIRYSTLQNGQTVLNFSAKYCATDTQIVPGDASSQVLFNVFYP
ncbi:fimbrial protein [Enterobacteriaceae bacterium G50]|nr:fimbrial protein [Enterobacteriaceae bacterium G50]